MGAHRDGARPHGLGDRVDAGAYDHGTVGVADKGNAFCGGASRTPGNGGALYEKPAGPCYA